MTQVIEIVVVGPVGSGKSHVLELIDRALRSEYGQHVQVTSHELSQERFMGSPGNKPNVEKTIFNLREQGEVTARHLDKMTVSVDASEVSSALSKIEAIQGEAMAFTFDRLESAIESIARMMRDEWEHMAEISRTMSGDVPTTTLYKRLGEQLDALLSVQLKRVSDYD
ncbi:hypothetical protein ACIQAL_13270 [Pseudomonas sp. NPDC088368]|uniref:hypothetical protein n=1 Tax=Pseudomonas sp. NPDC088368 TaxID=3364453 RepID=UPI003826311A